MSDAPRISGDGGVLGKKITEPRRSLDTFPLQEAVHTVEYSSDEVTSLCPVTGQPDQYTVTIILWNSPAGVESKSLKLYLQSFRDNGQFCEQFSATIAQDVRAATGAKDVRVVVVQKPRGGVAITAVTQETT